MLVRLLFYTLIYAIEIKKRVDSFMSVTII